MHSVWYGRLGLRIAAAERERTDHLTGGGAKDIAEYRESVGFIAGLKEAMRLAEELDRNMLGLGTNGQYQAANSSD